jgi:hypothetical protein
MTGDEHDRQRRVSLLKVLLEFKSIRTGHADIENQTARCVGGIRVKKRFR